MIQAVLDKLGNKTASNAIALHIGTHSQVTKLHLTLVLGLPHNSAHELLSMHRNEDHFGTGQFEALPNVPRQAHRFPENLPKQLVDGFQRFLGWFAYCDLGQRGHTAILNGLFTKGSPKYA